MITLRDGFTLIELIVTTALVGVLMVALLQVVTVTGRTQRMMRDQPVAQANTWQRTVDLIEHDLRSAHSAWFQDGQLELEGFGGWDRQSLKPIHEPAIVTYRLIDPVDMLGVHERPSTSDQVAIGSSNNRRWLVRDQRDVLDLGQQRPWRVLVAVDVERFDWQIEQEESFQHTPPQPNQAGLVMVSSNGDPYRIHSPHELSTPMSGGASDRKPEHRGVISRPIARPSR